MADTTPFAERTDSDMSSNRNESTDPAEVDPLASAEEATPAGVRSYIVKKGDTLFAIARSEYNDASKWRDIWDANRDRVGNKDKLSIGQELVLP